MTMKKSFSDIRNTFLGYFKKNDHTIVQSSSLVPENDQTLLFTNAGMVQFKDYFTGKVKPNFSKAATSQKCVRAGGKHNDLENVGYTARHHTFFEMLGNFSFGDYFKEEAIYHAWTVLTKEFSLNPEKLYITVFSEDEEAARIWEKLTGFQDEKIIRISTSDNFWSMGDTGPCGPCSEIFYDHGEKIFGGLPGTKDENGDRFIEIWNLVFMQYEQFADGNRVLLPKPSIDTGMGLERISAVLQEKHNNFEIDIFSELVKEIKKLTQNENGFTQSCNVIADHIRSICFLIADGVLPLNEGRGYVLRRIMRRAIRHTRMLGQKEPILFKLSEKLIHLMGDQYDELNQRKDLIKNVILEEEKRFGDTLDFGLKLVNESIENISNNILPGEIAFKLYDTYGFPIDLTADILKSKGISIDYDGFEKHMSIQRELSKKSGNLGIEIEECGNIDAADLNEISPTKKECYETCSITDSKIVFVKNINDEKSLIILDRTPFFAESGGQVGDKGIIENNSFKSKVMDTKSISINDNTFIVHYCNVFHGKPITGTNAIASVDLEKRKRISAHHSGTHILQAAIRNIVGNHVTQKGSSVDENRLRFDFMHNKPLSEDEITKIENLANEVITNAFPTKVVECSIDEAKKIGALAFFGEKYGSKVRVAQIGNHSKDSEYFSKEFCGGTHVSNTGEIGLLKIVTEGSIASGVRRIEAVCGLALLDFIRGEKLQVSNDITKLHEENKTLQKQLSQMKIINACSNAEVQIEICGKIKLENNIIKGIPASNMREVANDICNKSKNDVVIVIGIDENKVAFIVCVKDTFVDKISANDLVKIINEKIDGNGGGKKNIAQCGGSNISGINSALENVKEFLSKVV